MKHEQNQAKALIEIWGIMLRFRWRFILPAFITIVAVLVIGMMLPRKYRAEAIFESQNHLVRTEITTKGATNTYQTPAQAVMEEIAGAPAIDALRPKLDPLLDMYGQGEYKDRESFYRTLPLRIIVSKKQAIGDRYAVQYVGTDPQVARAVVNLLVENYIERVEDQMRDRLNESAEFFRQEVARSRQELQKHEAKMLTFEIEHDILLPHNPVNIQTLLSDRQLLLADLQQETETAREVVNQLNEELARTPETAPQEVHGPNPRKQALKKTLSDSEATLAEYISVMKMTDKHPDVQALRQRIADLRVEIEQTEDEIVTQTQVARNPKRDELELRLTQAKATFNSLETRQKSVTKEINQYSVQAAELYPVRNDYRRLEWDMAQAQRTLGFWEDNLRRLEMSMAAESGDRGVQLNFVSPCKALTRPVSPALSQVLAASAMLGVLAGALSVFFAYRTDETFISGDELARSFDLPLLGSVSELISRQQARLRTVRNLILYPTSATVMASVLLVMLTLLYFDLEKPHQFEELKNDPTGFFINQLSERSQPQVDEKMEAKISEDKADEETEKVVVGRHIVLTAVGNTEKSLID